MDPQLSLIMANQAHVSCKSKSTFSSKVTTIPFRHNTPIFESRHTKIKSFKSILSQKIFLIEIEYNTLWVYFIHFLSKNIFMIKWT